MNSLLTIAGNTGSWLGNAVKIHKKYYKNIDYMQLTNNEQVRAATNA